MTGEPSDISTKAPSMHERRRGVPAFIHDERTTAPASESPPSESRRTGGDTGRRIPGEPGLWVFVLGDMTLFGVFFLAFVVARKQTPESFAATAELLDVWSGLFNTVVLLSSSFCVLVALKALVDGRIVRARLFLVVTASLGVAFAIVKASEYQHLSTLGVSPTTNLFSTYYYVLTGIHLSHVIIGTVLLCACVFRLRTRTGDQRFTEGAGAYWHMVDALWMVLFPLLYLVPAAGY